MNVSGLIGYGVGGSVVLAKSNDYHVLLIFQGLTLLVLGAILMNRTIQGSKGLATWIGVLGASLVARFITLAITKASSVNKAAKFRRWDSLMTTLGYAATMGYLMTSVIPGRSVTRYLELTAIGIPSATAASLILFDDPETDLSVYADFSNKAYSQFTHREPATDTRLLVSPGVVAFAGTDSGKNTVTDLKVLDVSFGACGNTKTRVHAGFMKAWLSVRAHVLDKIKEFETVTLTGHSLGGALATIAGLDIQCTTGKTVRVITFGSPQVGDELFADEFEKRVKASTRVVNPLDPVPKSLSAQFAHVHGLYYVPGGLNPHDMDKYLEAVSKPALQRVVGVVLPVIYVVILLKLLGAVRRPRSAGGR